MKAFFSLLFILVCLWGCEKKIIEDLPVVIPDDLSFSQHIQPYFTSNCISCHNGPSSPGGLNLAEGSSYESITAGGLIDKDNPKDSPLYVYVKDGHQKGGPGLQDPTIAAYILAWIEQDAPEN